MNRPRNYEVRRRSRSQFRCLAVALALLDSSIATNELGAQRQEPATAFPRSEHLDLFKSGFGAIRMQSLDGHELTVHWYRATRFDRKMGRIWFVLHGTNRTAKTYVKAAAPVAERADALVVVVEFPKSIYPHSSDYTLGVTTKGPPDAAALAEGRWRSAETYRYAEIERAFDLIRNSLDGAQSGYYLFGHSAGAQFVHRLLTFLADARVIAAVAANAGWYTLPVRHSSPNFTFPYGLGATPVEEVAIRRLLSRRLTLLLGEMDTVSAHADRDVRCTREAMAQGANRMQRGRNYFSMAEKEARRLGVDFGWRLAIVPKAEHKAAHILPSVVPFLFSEDISLCAPSKASEQIEFAEIVYDPPDGSAGDLNRDGTRVGIEDEYVTLRNPGPTPMCLSGWTLGDTEDERRHVFPLGTRLEAGEALTVFGGGIPTGDFGLEIQWARSGRLSLSNKGDVIQLRDSAGRLGAKISW